MILARIEKRDHIHYDNVAEAMERMRADGITEVIVQPTHVMNGVENDLMKKDVLACADHFRSVKFGAPLLTTEEDNEYVVKAVADEFPVIRDKETALVLMGHGTEHFANAAYCELEHKFRTEGYANVYVGTVEGYPTLNNIIPQLQAAKIKRILLLPFLIVAGDHARNDLSGDTPDSWKSRLEALGFETRTVLMGLGEIPEIAQKFAGHLKEME